jgi:hypothetical protein
MNDDAHRTVAADPQQRSSADIMTADVYEDAIAEVVRLILELTSTNQALDYPNGARVRVELENALQEAQHTFEAIPDGRFRARAMGRLDAMRIAADRQLKIAPSCINGRPSASPREVEEWTAQRLGYGSSPRSTPRRPRSDTRPDSPGAMKRVMSNEAPMPVAAVDRALEKVHR